MTQTFPLSQLHAPRWTECSAHRRYCCEMARAAGMSLWRPLAEGKRHKLAGLFASGCSVGASFVRETTRCESAGLGSRRAARLSLPSCVSAQPDARCQPALLSTAQRRPRSPCICLLCKVACVPGTSIRVTGVAGYDVQRSHDDPLLVTW
ncbi:hypothetical protein IE81DRAFT_2079 [Ceraceosorus guamensis]|uniref:Uncharacterized protein n=1 Tax=Ceraceosorus guamensis TaxID=1522189 RepID=A0A316WEV3_9BASI|nr:hypothetical protein IE81DRAFT_2079 [Ceraceosorus guamensis]PWN46263.1 hypothetical protein IE81DRAFT_2079 [Ceraceosorus guamensis]